MPTIDRRPRRRLHGATQDFSTETEACAAADAVRAMAEPRRSQEWRTLLPRLRRWIVASWRVPKADPEWVDAAARSYYLVGRFRRQQSPGT
jgi:hypothetical protein